MMHMLPPALNTDAQWAMLCAWLGERGFILHIPLRGEMWLERKRST